MTLQRLHLMGWQAWAPALTDKDSWRTWLAQPAPLEVITGKPASKRVPAMLRRRCGANARMVMECALDLCEELERDPQDMHIVYGSPNGENHALAQLLEDLSVDEPLSPTAFTNSLHHVPTGYHSIVTQHRGVSRTISAFENTFTCGWLEAAALLSRKQDKPVLLMVSDEIPPQPFDQLLEVPDFPYAVAMLLRNAEPNEMGISFARGNGEISPRLHRELLFDFLKWYDSDQPTFLAATSLGDLQWQKQ